MPHTLTERFGSLQKYVESLREKGARRSASETDHEAESSSEDTTGGDSVQRSSETCSKRTRGSGKTKGARGHDALLVHPNRDVDAHPARTNLESGRDHRINPERENHRLDDLSKDTDRGANVCQTPRRRKWTIRRQ